MTADALAARFGGGGPIMTARAPGRVNLIGEHTDYNEGFVLPTGIEAFVEAAVRPAAGRQVRLLALDAGEELGFCLGDPLGDAAPRWSRYIHGVCELLREAGHLEAGFDLAFRGTVPQGGGLSSSAALETAVSIALEGAFGIGIDALDAARLCREAERCFAGVQCGIMDQMASRFAKRDHALFLDCRSLERRDVPLDLGDHRLVLTDSGVQRSLGDSEYNRRSEECAAAVERLARDDPGVRNLRDVEPAGLERAVDRLPATLAARVRHVIEENERVLLAEKGLRDGDLAGFGELMLASHASLRDLYEVSHRELDRLVDAAMGVDGVLGSRMTGAGFGGNTITLCRADAVDEYRARVGRDVTTLVGPATVAGVVEATG